MPSPGAGKKDVLSLKRRLRFLLQANLHIVGDSKALWCKQANFKATERVRDVVTAYTSTRIPPLNLKANL